MIIQRLVLHNFGVYRGRHEIDLSPPKENKNVILFGALNGAGKTTILDAIQLVMHGKLANCSTRGSSSYEDFLRRCIHRGVDPKEGAALELEFSHRSGAEEHVYRIRRSWTVPSNKAREALEVAVDDRNDPTLASSWQEYAEIFLPSGLAPLFLFDGEKIERLADPDQSADMLRTAIHSLLGLDIVDQLSADLAVLSRRKQEDLKDNQVTSDIDALEGRIKEAETKRAEYVEERAALLNRQTRCEKRLRAVESKYRKEGGETFEQKAVIEAELAAARTRRGDVNERLREIAAGDAPLLLVAGLLQQIGDENERSQLITQAQSISEVLKERDASALQLLESAGSPKNLVTRLTAYLEEDRKKRAKIAATETTVSLSGNASIDLNDFLRRGAKERSHEISRMIEDSDQLQTTVDDLDRRLASVPQEATIEALAAAVDDEKKQVLEVEKGLTRISVLLEEVGRSLERLAEQRERLLRRNVDGQFKSEDSQRVALHTNRLRDTLGNFRTALLERNVSKLSGFVLESYRQLLRKSSLVKSIEIDPNDFSVTLISPSGESIQPDRLSAGERQLLATAILWGLARAAGQALPMVIDTPLGRLDSTHRTKLVEQYFPHASHQVILLSTDEEIDERYYPKLKPWIGRTYSLEFDDETDSTHVRTGYFPVEAAE